MRSSTAPAYLPGGTGPVRITGTVPEFRRTLAGLVLFAVSFGYVEAAVVVYLRHIYGGLRPEGSSEIFPLMDAGTLYARSPEAFRLLLIEIGREAATIAMLAAAALVAARARRTWLPAFAVAFGAWDIAFYGWLKALIGWPESLATWDLLFLIPAPWTGPVWSPMVVAATMMVCGTLALRQPVLLRRMHWIGLLAGAALILAAFLWDFREIAAGALPQSFAWPLFWAGELGGAAAFAHAFRASRRTA